MKNFIKILCLCMICLLTGATLSAQVTEKPAKDNRPVRAPFESQYLINNQTVIVPTAKTLEYVIQHRFGTLNSESFDLLGLYAPSNIRMGINFSLTKDLVLGIGSTKSSKMQDANVKYAILRQTRSGSIPVSMSFYGNAAIDARDKDLVQFSSATNRLSYYGQLIISRKFNHRLSLQVSPSFGHFNIVEADVLHDNIMVSVNGRYRIVNQTSVIFEYDYQLTNQTAISPKPNIGLGIEMSTSSHAFQIFVSSFDKIIPQRNMVYGVNDFAENEILIGFNITRLWNL
jgi:Membrane bound beta barrel domain (DUF5777)